MKKRYVCDPVISGDAPLVFEWDESTGEVTGEAAETILAFAVERQLVIHPYPTVWRMSKQPTRSKQDMAAIIGRRHRLPADLAAHYPKRGTEEQEEGVVY